MCANCMQGKLCSCSCLRNGCIIYVAGLPDVSKWAGVDVKSLQVVSTTQHLLLQRLDTHQPAAAAAGACHHLWHRHATGICRARFIVCQALAAVKKITKGKQHLVAIPSHPRSALLLSMPRVFALASESCSCTVCIICPASCWRPCTLPCNCAAVCLLRVVCCAAAPPLPQALLLQS